jgi:hypothetical protein
MTEALYIKCKGALLPADEQSKELFNAMPVGEELLISYKQGRSVQNHKRFFTLVNRTFDWQDEFTNKNVWVYVLKILAGHFYPVIGKNGVTQYVPKSINFNSADEGEFRQFFNKVIQGYLGSDYARGLSNKQLTMVAEY